MANYATLKAAIADVIKTNGNEEITGEILQNALVAMINSLGAGYQFAGVAIPATTPGTPDNNVVYIAGAGTYPNFGATVVPKGSIGIFSYNGSWTYDTIDISDILPAYININELANHPAAYADAATALADVPQLYRRTGVKVVYFDNTQQLWIEMLCIDDAGVNWWTDVANNWVIEGPIETDVTTPTGGKQLRIGGDKKGNLDDVLNVNVWNEQIAAYATQAAARAAVPANKRKLGAIITYLVSTGIDTSQWVQDMFIGDDVTDWSVADNWKVVGPVTVTQNTETGKTELLIGDTPALIVDNEPEAGSDNLVKSGGVLAELNSKQQLNNENNIVKLSDFEWIDNFYIDNTGKLQSIPATETYQYKAISKLPVKQFERLIIDKIESPGLSYVVCLSQDGQIIDTYQADTIQSLTIDNANRNIFYISFSVRFSSSLTSFSITAIPRKYCKGLSLLNANIVPIDVPDELWYNSARLTAQNELRYVSGPVNVIKDFNISEYAELVFSPLYDVGLYSIYNLVSASGVITSLSYSGITRIDNSNHQYKYLSVCFDTNIAIYGVDAKLQNSQAIDFLQDKIIYVERKCTVDDVQFELLDTSAYIRENTMITNAGVLKYVSQGATYKYNSIVFFPVSDLTMFVISGTTGSSYVALYDSNFALIQSRQGTNITIDNTDGSICYVSFGANIMVQSLYIKAYINESVSSAIKRLSNDVYYDRNIWKKKDVVWVAHTYINADNEQNAMADGPTYSYSSVRNVNVYGCKKIRYSLTFGGTARVVILDAAFNIIDAYTDNEKTIDNSDGRICYISLCNNVIATPNPIFLIEVQESIKDYCRKPLDGKNIAILGDSIMMIMSEGNITGGTTTYVGTDGITYALSDLTNIGGLLYVTSTLEGGQIVDTTIQADVHNSNQTDLNLESWPKLKDALNAHYIINTGRGGARITGADITTAYPAHGQSTFNTMPNHCLELKRRVDNGEPTPDLIMMWAGTNDLRDFVVNDNWVEPTNFDEIMALDYETQLLANTDAAMNYKKTFYGGLRFCIEFLYRNFPNATVVFFSPIPSIVSPRTYERERFVGSYIKRMAERYGALFIDSCVEMGITDKFDTPTNHVWLYDGLHPNDAGKVLYCNYTAKKLNNIMFAK